MKTRTFYYPNFKDPTTIMEVSIDGDIINCSSWVPDLDLMADCTAGAKERPVWIKRAQEFAAEADWEDSEGSHDYLETLKESLGPDPIF